VSVLDELKSKPWFPWAVGGGVILWRSNWGLAFVSGLSCLRGDPSEEAAWPIRFPRTRSWQRFGSREDGAVFRLGCETQQSTGIIYPLSSIFIISSITGDGYERICGATFQ